MVRVQDDPQLSVPELVAFADRALSGLEQRCIAFDSASVAEPLRTEFHALGFRSVRLTLMRFEGPVHTGPEIPIREVDYDAVRELRRSWNQEDLFPGVDDSEFEDQAREVRLALGMRVLAVFDGAEPIAFATLDLGDDEIEIGGLYVLPEYRGFGRGTALTKAAISAAGSVKNLWICADDEDRPKELYSLLGFRPVLTWTNFLRLTS